MKFIRNSVPHRVVDVTVAAQWNRLGQKRNKIGAHAIKTKESRNARNGVGFGSSFYERITRETHRNFHKKASAESQKLPSVEMIDSAYCGQISGIVLPSLEAISKLLKC